MGNTRYCTEGRLEEVKAVLSHGMKKERLGLKRRKTGGLPQVVEHMPSKPRP